jgi:hypothetical protein
MFNLFLTYNIYKNMKAPHSKLFESLPKQIRKKIMLGKINSFAHDGKTYNVTDGESDIRKTMDETSKIIKDCDDYLEKCRFDEERSNKINKLNKKITGELPFKRHWWSNIKFFV